jgi:hypothetical protein
MAKGELSWYHDMLLLPAEGGVPSLPAGRLKATKQDCITAFGPTTIASRYNFQGRGCLQYELYTKELLERTQQEDAENVTTLLYQVACGLVDEENGLVVYWTLFVPRRHV